MNIEEKIIDYLEEAFDNDLPVYAERPATPPTSYLVVDKTGAELVNFINQATIIVQSVAPTMYDASELNDDVKAIMMTLAENESDITAISLETDYDNTDTALKDYRYEAVFNISYY